MTPSALRIIALCCATSLAAAEAPAPELDPIVVTASKLPLRLSQVAGQISVIDGAAAESALATSLDDLLRGEPGVEAARSGTRFGVDGVFIRGIGGNRVAIEVDGVPLRPGFAIGSYANGGRDLVEVDRVRRLEIRHGPSSTLFGSDALGGVLAFETWDPADRVSGGAYAAARLTASGADRSLALSSSAAYVAGPHGIGFSAVRREGSERAAEGMARSELDAQDWDSRDFAARYTFDTRSGGRLRLSAERFERAAATELRSLPGYARFRRTTRLTGDDQDRQTRVFADYRFGGERIEHGVLRAFQTTTITRQHSEELRDAPPERQAITRRFRLDDRISGVELNLFGEWRIGRSLHRLGGGVEYQSREVSELRDGLLRGLDTGTETATLLGEPLPTRDFPHSRTRQLGIFVEDAVRLADGRWELTPALRYDHVRLDPRADALYRLRFPDTRPVALSEGRLTPRLAALRRFGDNWSAYAQYARGFRAPPPEDVNIGFELAMFRFRAIPNPDLRSEHSRGIELGVRRFGDGGRFELTAFDTHFRDFIESRALLGVDPASGYRVFQSRNIERARIYGLDLRHRQQLGALRPEWNAWSLSLAALWARGENQHSQTPLNTVPPPQAVLGMNWDSADGRLDARLTLTLTARKRRIDMAGGERFPAPSHQVIDLALGWRPRPGIALRAGVFNLTDQRYWRWQDIHRLDRDHPMVPRLAQPGRHVSLSLHVDGRRNR